eukprot:gene17102-23399_t
MDDASDATGHFITEVLLRNVPRTALLDPDDFRFKRMYNEEMDMMVQFHWDLLLAMHKLYRARDCTKYFWVEHWHSLLNSAKLFGAHTGLERREAKLIFAWSQLIVPDELKRRKKAISLTFFDLVEALARVADLMSPPSHEELIVWYNTNSPTPTAAHQPNTSPSSTTEQQHDTDTDNEGGTTPIDEGAAEPTAADIFLSKGGNLMNCYYLDRAPVGANTRPKRKEPFLDTPSQPLHVNFGRLMEYVLHHMIAAWGGKDEKDCANKMMKMATMINGGVELG